MGVINAPNRSVQPSPWGSYLLKISPPSNSNTNQYVKIPIANQESSKKQKTGGCEVEAQIGLHKRRDAAVSHADHSLKLLANYIRRSPD